MPPARLTALMAKRWCRLPPSTARPLIWQTPRLVLRIAFSTSWTAKALPVRSTSTQPSRTRRARCTSPPECTIAGPATTTIFSPRLAGLPHLPGRALDGDPLVDLGRDVVRHEAEDRVVAAALGRPHPDARGPAGPPARPSSPGPASRSGAPRRAARGRSPSSGPGPRSSSPSNAHEGVEVGGGVELVGQDAVGLRAGEPGVRRRRSRPRGRRGPPGCGRGRGDPAPRPRSGRTRARRWSCRPGTPGPRTPRPPRRCGRRPGAGCRSR